MFTITNKQMEVFSAYMMDSFIKKAKNHLRQKFSALKQPMTDEELTDIINCGIIKAAEYDIIEREDVLPFIEYMICFGLDFDKKVNRICEILNMEDIEGSDKMALLIFEKPIYPE